MDQNGNSTASAGSYLVHTPAAGHIVTVDDFRIGIADDPLNAGFDYSLFDQTKRLKGFSNMQSYVGQDAWKPFTVDLLDDLPEPLKSPYQSKFLRTIAPIGGKNRLGSTRNCSWQLVRPRYEWLSWRDIERYQFVSTDPSIDPSEQRRYANR